MYRQVDRNLLASTQSLALALYSRVERLEENLDKLLQSHAALEQQQQKEFASLAGYVGANQAVLDTLVQRQGDDTLAIRALIAALERKLDAKHPYTQQMWNDIQIALNNKFEQFFGVKRPVNGKRKRKAA